MRLFTLIEVDNKSSKGQSEVGNIQQFNFDGVVFHFGNIRSSRVSNITCTALGIVVKTKNSIYTFEAKEKM